MKEKVFVDTSALYALIDADDPAHRHATAAWAAAVAQDRDFVTTQLVFVETHAVTLRRLGLDAIDDLDVIADALDIVPISMEMLSVARKRWALESRRQLSLVDCCSLQFIADNAIDDVIAFDRHFSAYRRL